MNSPDSSPPGGPAAPPPDPVPAREPTVTEAAALAAAATARRGVVAGGGIESALERVATELLRQQGVERRWRVFFRLAWLGLALAVVGMGFSSQFAAQRTHHAAHGAGGSAG